MQSILQIYSDVQNICKKHYLTQMTYFSFLLLHANSFPHMHQWSSSQMSSCQRGSFIDQHFQLPFCPRNYPSNLVVGYLLETNQAYQTNYPLCDCLDAQRTLVTSTQTHTSSHIHTVNAQTYRYLCICVKSLFVSFKIHFGKCILHYPQ